MGFVGDFDCGKLFGCLVCVAENATQVVPSSLRFMPAGQHVPHVVALDGGQHAPSDIMTLPSLLQGATHVLPSLNLPSAQPQVQVPVLVSFARTTSSAGQLQTTGLGQVPSSSGGSPEFSQMHV